MVEKLRIKTIYDDFVSNVHLTEEQIRIINMLINKETIVKIAMEIGVSDRTVNTEIRKIKDLYNQYCRLQLLKADILSK